jgi:hypothetical protein
VLDDGVDSAVVVVEEQAPSTHSDIAAMIAAAPRGKVDWRSDVRVMHQANHNGVLIAHSRGQFVGMLSRTQPNRIRMGDRVSAPVPGAE